MAPVLRQGWELDNSNNSSVIFKAKVPQRTVPGSSFSFGSENVEIVNNTSTGNFDVYQTRSVGPRPDKSIFSYNASDNKTTIVSQEAYDRYYSTTDGQKQFKALVTSAKEATFDLAQINTGTDTVNNANFERLKTRPGYQSLANRSRDGQRAAPPGSPSGSDAQGGNPTEGETPIDLSSSQTSLSNLKISDSATTRKVSDYPEFLLKYPIDMSGKQDCIKFTMLKYASRSIELSKIAEGSPLGERGGGTRDRGKTVVLPIQPTISDTNSVRWGSDEMNAGQLIAAAAALKTIADGAEGATASIKGITDLFKGSAKDLKTAFAAGFAGEAVGTKGLLTRVTGGVVNPNMELLFQGPELRTFNFNFSLSAREEKEAQNIRNIIRFFKQGMSVKRADTALFLKSPHTFEIKYMFNGDEHPWINKIKECVLTSCSVNYTPAGNYATYEDGSMTQYDISLSFSELEPIYDDDYGNGGGTENETEIGY